MAPEGGIATDMIALDRDGFEVRKLYPGMGQAVAERSILRKLDPETRTELPKNAPKGTPFEWEGWGDVARRVAFGNASLTPVECGSITAENTALRRHLSKATLLMSGRHLQHGDVVQGSRPMEVFTNCSTAPTSYLQFLLLLSGSGVGRCYDDDMMLVNWDNAPNLRCVLDHTHPDFDWSAHESVRDARHKYPGPDVMWFEVPDSREGWAKALEHWEVAAFEKVHKDKLLILDFTKVRCKGSPIGGMQNRPASGPVPLMNAFTKAASLKGSGMAPFMQTLYIDHYFAECVLVGGARRAARMATKHWKDKGVIDFIRVKRPIEYAGMSLEEVLEYRAGLPKDQQPQAYLWSANNSVVVDAEYWRLAALPAGVGGTLADHARAVSKALREASYGDGTGEPGLLNAHKLVRNDDGLEDLTKGDYIGSERYQIDEDTVLYMSRLAKRAAKKEYNMIVNPCGEIALFLLGGFCVIADVVPFHADTLDEAEDAFRVAARALIRVNLMNSVYQKEVRRTNRIGIGMTGVHEFAWKFFKVGFRDLINPDFPSVRDFMFDPQFVIAGEPAATRAALFWLTLSRFNRAVREEADSYSRRVGLPAPHTLFTIKPAGTTSKLFGLTEGWHLPAMAWYLRWVQFRNDDPLVQQYERAGYPIKVLTQYPGTTVVGFPTAPMISTLGMGDALVLAADATPEEQYTWLALGEFYWIVGVSAEGKLMEDRGNQISYTLKYDPKRVDFDHFSEMLMKWQPLIRACSVMPQEDGSAYEYLPEQGVTKAEYEAIAFAIANAMPEDVGKEHLDCAGGACPVDFNTGDKA